MKNADTSEITTRPACLCPSLPAKHKYKYETELETETKTETQTRKKNPKPNRDGKPQCEPQTQPQFFLCEPLASPPLSLCPSPFVPIAVHGH